MTEYVISYTLYVFAYKIVRVCKIGDYNSDPELQTEN